MASTSKVTTLVEVKSPFNSTTPFEVEVIIESHVPHFNPPLSDTLDYVLQEASITDNVPISPNHIIMSSVKKTSSS